MQQAPSQQLLQPWQDVTAQPFLRIDGIVKSFGEAHAVDNLSLDIHQGEFFALLGGSGCGKSTLLRMLAGLERPSAGRIFIDGADMTDVPPYERPVNMMFQSYALFPHMTVEQNIAFGLKQDRLPAQVIRERVEEILELVRMAPYARRKPHQLSGGQNQRVALARSLVKHPKLLLLDEPLGALDRKLREHTQFELMNIQKRVGITFVMVTHDQDEAMTMATRIAVMDAGRIQQLGTPASIYEYPANRFVAEFIGSVNVFSGRVSECLDDHAVIASEEAGCDLYIEHPQALSVGTPVSVAVRPEKIAVTEETTGKNNCVKAVVEEIAYLGDVSVYMMRLANGKTVRVQMTNLTRFTERPLLSGQHVHLSWQPGSGVVLQG